MPKKLPSFLTEQEQQRLIYQLQYMYDDNTVAFAIKRNIVMTMLCIETGMRSAEVVNLRLQNLNLEEHTARVLGKGGRERLVGIADTSWFMLMNYLLKVMCHPIQTVQRAIPDVYVFPAHVVFDMLNKSHTTGWLPISTRLFRREVKRLGIMCGLTQELHPHMLRHSFATLFYQDTKNLVWLSKVLGHASLQTTQIYTHCIMDEAISQMRTRRWVNDENQPSR